MPAQVGAVGAAGVEVADALVVREEGDPAGDGHGGGEVSGVLGQDLLAVRPEPADGAAPVALPGGGLVRGGAGEQDGPFAAHLGVADRAPGHPAAGGAVRRQGVRPGVVAEGLVEGGDGQHLAVRQPAADPGVLAAPEAEPAGLAAVDGGGPHLGGQAQPAGPGEGGAVGGEAGVADPGAVAGDPPGPAGDGAGGVQRGDPDVVLGGEGEQAAVQVGVAEVAGRGHPSILRRGVTPGNRDGLRGRPESRRSIDTAERDPHRAGR